MSDQDPYAEVDAIADAIAAERADIAEQQGAALVERQDLAAQIAELLGLRQQAGAQETGLLADIAGLRVSQDQARTIARTAAVELATSTGGDFYAADVGQQVAPDGTVTYDFDAHLHARGIDIDVSTDDLAPPLDRRVRWLRVDGAVVADVYGYDTPTQYGSALRMTRPEGGIAFIEANHDKAAAVSKVHAATITSAGARQDRTILDANGASNFAQLAEGVAQRTLSFGSAICTFGGSTFTPLVTVPHGLGRVPLTILLTCGVTSDGASNCWAVYANPTASNFQITANAPTARANGVTVPVLWLAIG